MQAQRVLAQAHKAMVSGYRHAKNTVTACGITRGLLKTLPAYITAALTMSVYALVYHYLLLVPKFNQVCLHGMATCVSITLKGMAANA